MPRPRIYVLTFTDDGYHVDRVVTTWQAAWNHGARLAAKGRGYTIVTKRRHGLLMREDAAIEEYEAKQGR